MSGGVDSSVSAYLLKEQGHQCIGITMKLFSNEDICLSWKKVCCSQRDIEDASNVCSTLEIPFYVNDFTNDFKSIVIERFIDIYRKGATPNPCIDCNRFIKFPKLLQRAKLFDADYVVTGHYARIVYENGRYLLKKANDVSKDQSYVLYTLTQDQLSRLLFPLGELHKTEVRNIAKKLGLLNAEKEDSQDICFVPDGDYSSFIEKYTNQPNISGNFLDMKGNILGKHNGIIKYTIGQRRGLGIALNKPMYVFSKNINDNTVVLCEDEELFCNTLTATDFNWIAYDYLNKPIKIKAKIRYNQEEESAVAEQISDNDVRINFDKPQRAIAPGQAVVLYDNDIVVGGGTIAPII